MQKLIDTRGHDPKDPKSAFPKVVTVYLDGAAVNRNHCVFHLMAMLVRASFSICFS